MKILNPIKAVYHFFVIVAISFPMVVFSEDPPAKVEVEKEIQTLLKEGDLSSSNTHYQLGELYVKAGDFKEARVHVDKALDLDPKNTDANTISEI